MGGAARSPEPEFLIGSSVNAALANFSKGLSKLGMRDGVNVNVIHPGNTATERQEELLAQRAAATGKSVEELRAAALAKSGIRRVGQVGGHRGARAVPVLGARPPHPGHGHRGRWRRDRRILLKATVEAWPKPPKPPA